MSGETKYEQPEDYTGPTDTREKDEFDGTGGSSLVMKERPGDIEMDERGGYEGGDRSRGDSVLDKYTNVLRQQTSITEETVPFSPDCEL